ncbi:hypothetical protein D9M70_623490 [compost metagenome]
MVPEITQYFRFHMGQFVLAVAQGLELPGLVLVHDGVHQLQYDVRPLFAAMVDIVIRFGDDG